MGKHPPMTAAQQAVAVRAMALIPACLRDFYKRFACLRPVAANCDLEGAAMLAVCTAARTYDEERAGLSAYFSVAIKNGCLREVQKEIRSQSHSHYRITFEALTQRVKVKNSQVEPSESKVFPTMMAGLTETERNWIESWVFDKTSLRAFGRQSGKDPRTAKRLLLSYLDKCRAVLEPGHGLSDQDSEGSAPRPS